MSKFYLVLGVETEQEIVILGSRVPLGLSWAKGMFGVCPVFDNEKDAKSYSNGKFEVVEIFSGKA